MADSDLRTDVAWIKEMLTNHLKSHEKISWVIIGSLVSALIAAGTGIISLVIALNKVGT
jgi:ABC-type polysaccharide transport system permease subunit